ncbi:hypothetical protein ACPC54_19600 [Kitasatospora sp. NPDC094028]
MNIAATEAVAEQPVLVIENLDQPGDAASFCDFCLRDARTEA